MIARPLQICTMKDGIGRNLFCVDRNRDKIEITLWKEFNDVQIDLN